MRAHRGVCGCWVCPSLLPQLPTRPLVLRLSSEAPPQLETSLGPWVFWDPRGCGGGRRGLQASLFGSDSGSALLAVVRASVSFFPKRGQQCQLHQCRAGRLAEACVNRELPPCVSSSSFLALFLSAGILLFVVRILAQCPVPPSPCPWPHRGCFQSLPHLLSGPGEVAGLCGPSYWVSGITGVLSTRDSLIMDPRGWGVLLDPQERCLDSGFMARSLCRAGSVCFPCLSRGAS